MTEEANLRTEVQNLAPAVQRQIRLKRNGLAAPLRLTAQAPEDDASHRSAELFYLQKQIHAQTQMVIVLEDGERLEGCIEWYDRHAIKIRGKSKSLIYKAAIRYMYKQGESMQ